MVGVGAFTENFRSALNGYNRTDVVQFIQRQTIEHEKAMRLLREENARLKQAAAEPGDKGGDRQAEIDELLKAKSENLADEYLVDDYIYLINRNGTPGDFTGLKGNINKDKNGNSLDVPYKVCTVHTKEALEKLQEATKPTVDPNDPGANVPGETTPPGGSVTPVG